MVAPSGCASAGFRQDFAATPRVRACRNHLTRQEFTMNAAVADVVAESANAARYARCLAASKKTEWEIDKDLMRGRTFDFSHKFLPDGLSLVDRLGFLSEDE